MQQTKAEKNYVEIVYDHCNICWKKSVLIHNAAYKWFKREEREMHTNQPIHVSTTREIADYVDFITNWCDLIYIFVILRYIWSKFNNLYENSSERTEMCYVLFPTSLKIPLLFILDCLMIKLISQKKIVVNYIIKHNVRRLLLLSWDCEI